MNTKKLEKLRGLKRYLDREDATTDPVDMIAGLFPRGYMSIVASMAGVGKTWLMQYIACQLSLGGQILSGLAPNSKPQKVLIFSGETGHEMLNRRLAKTDWAFNIENIAIYCAIEMGLNDVEYNLNLPEGRDTINAICLTETPDIVFFDTLISFHTAEENKQGEMTSIYTFLRKLAKNYNCAVVVNHHTRKRPTKETGRKFTQEDVIGTSSGVRVANAVYIITSNNNDDENEDGLSIQTVENVKAWEEKIPPFSYKFIKKFGGFTDFEVNLDIKENWSVSKRVRDYVTSMEFQAIFSTADVAQRIGASEQAVHYNLEKLMTDEQLLSVVYVMGKKMYQKK